MTIGGAAELDSLQSQRVGMEIYMLVFLVVCFCFYLTKMDSGVMSVNWLSGDYG